VSILLDREEARRETIEVGAAREKMIALLLLLFRPRVWFYAYKVADLVTFPDTGICKWQGVVGSSDG
jgi:hypothetical protein